jgi:hypothetical protein
VILALIRTLTLILTLNLTLIVLTPGDLKAEGHDFEVLPNMHGMRDERAVHQGSPAVDEKFIRVAPQSMKNLLPVSGDGQVHTIGRKK